MESLGTVFFQMLLTFLNLGHTIATLICDLPRLIKYGPRYWRITRQMDRRATKRRL